jgi:hypothetical protein
MKGIPTVYRTGTGLTNEVYLKELVQTHRQKSSSPATFKRRTVSTTKSPPILDDIRSKWRCFIEYYSGNELTKDSDIFVALQGIAQDVVADTLKDRLIAGLSESHFTEELCWMVLGRSKSPQKLEHWRAPSWSWASTRHSVAIPRYTTNYRQTRHDLIKVVICNVPTKPSGELIDALLSMECKLIPVEIWQYEWEAKILLYGVQQDFESMFVSIDNQCVEEEGGLFRGVFLMPIAYNEDGPHCPERLEGLALEICDESDERFRRMGFFHIGVAWSDNPDHEASKEVFEKAMRTVQETEARVIEIV